MNRTYLIQITILNAKSKLNFKLNLPKEFIVNVTAPNWVSMTTRRFVQTSKCNS